MRGFCGKIAVTACDAARQIDREDPGTLQCSLSDSFDECMKRLGHDAARISQGLSEYYQYAVKYKQLGCSALARRSGTSFPDFRADVSECSGSAGVQTPPVSTRSEMRKDFVFVQEVIFESIEACCRAMRDCFASKGYTVEEGRMQRVQEDKKDHSAKDRFDPKMQHRAIRP
jgi:hypothetical protein